MKKYCSILLFLFITVFCISCTSGENEFENTSFKIITFNKMKTDSIYVCEATIEIRNIPNEYSIDGILKTNTVPNTELEVYYSKVNGPFFKLFDSRLTLGKTYFSSRFSYNIYQKSDGDYYFNLYGEHHGNLILKIKFTSTEDLDNYLIGWHLSYGFTEDCKVLMINLEKNT